MTIYSIPAKPPDFPLHNHQIVEMEEVLQYWDRAVDVMSRQTPEEKLNLQDLKGLYEFAARRSLSRCVLCGEEYGNDWNALWDHIFNLADKELARHVLIASMMR